MLAKIAQQIGYEVLWALAHFVWTARLADDGNVARRPSAKATRQSRASIPLRSQSQASSVRRLHCIAKAHGSAVGVFFSKPVGPSSIPWAGCNPLHPRSHDRRPTCGAQHRSPTRRHNPRRLLRDLPRQPAKPPCRDQPAALTAEPIRGAVTRSSCANARPPCRRSRTDLPVPEYLFSCRTNVRQSFPGRASVNPDQP